MTHHDRVNLAIVVAAALLAVAGTYACVRWVQANYVSEGYVTAKSFTREYWATEYITVNETRIPRAVHHPASYSITIQGRRADGSLGTWSHSVTAPTYERAEPGMYYRNGALLESAPPTEETPQW